MGTKGLTITTSGGEKPGTMSTASESESSITVPIISTIDVTEVDSADHLSTVRILQRIGNDAGKTYKQQAANRKSEPAVSRSIGKPDIENVQKLKRRTEALGLRINKLMSEIVNS
jgi:hypothetical protein